MARSRCCHRGRARRVVGYDLIAATPAPAPIAHASPERITAVPYPLWRSAAAVTTLPAIDDAVGDVHQCRRDGSSIGGAQQDAPGRDVDRGDDGREPFERRSVVALQSRCAGKPSRIVRRQHLDARIRLDVRPTRLITSTRLRSVARHSASSSAASKRGPASGVTRKTGVRPRCSSQRRPPAMRAAAFSSSAGSRRLHGIGAPRVAAGRATHPPTVVLDLQSPARPSSPAISIWRSPAEPTLSSGSRR